jgi:HAD superfamily hydrolase (TIGR01549 family)
VRTLSHLQFLFSKPLLNKTNKEPKSQQNRQTLCHTNNIVSPSQKKESLQAILFDVDGTLVNSLQQCIRGLSDMYANYADRIPSDEEIQALMGVPLKKQARLFTSRELSEEEVQERINYALERYKLYQDRVEEYAPAIDALIKANKAGIKTALVTSKNQREIEEFIVHFRGAEWVDVIICADDVEHPKPNPQSAVLAMKKLNVAPENTAMIGDSIFDLQCARDAKVTSVAVTYGAGQELDLLAQSPDLVLSSPDEVLMWVQEQLREPCLERKP